jgi:hypothetical protein
MSVLTSADITGIGAQAALWVFNCGIGRFTKEGPEASKLHRRKRKGHQRQQKPVSLC